MYDSCILEAVCFENDTLTVRLVVYDHGENNTKSVRDIVEADHIVGSDFGKTVLLLSRFVSSKTKFNNHMNRPIGKTTSFRMQVERALQSCLVEGVKYGECDQH